MKILLIVLSLFVALLIGCGDDGQVGKDQSTSIDAGPDAAAAVDTSGSAEQIASDTSQEATAGDAVQE